MITTNNITLQMVLEVIGGIALISGAFVTIKNVFMPMLKINKRVEKLEESGEEMKEKIECVNCTENLLCKGMIGLINNSITGNGIENLKKIRDEMIEYVTKNN